MADGTGAANTRNLFLIRLGIGLVQGLALFALYDFYENGLWPAVLTQGFAPAVFIALFVPPLLLQGWGNLEKRNLLIWAGIAILIAALFGWYDIWHRDAMMSAHWFRDGYAWTPPLPEVLVWLFTAAFLFVGHALISCGDADRRYVSRYTVLFDIAWKLGVQFAIAVCFVLAFWIILFIGVALFEMIHLHFFRDLINHNWFWIPATTLAIAVAVHITDTRITLVRGVRTLALMLLGWLLPVLVAISFLFLVSLVFTGLTPLWQTKTAALLLIFAAVVIVIHINAVFQDGNVELKPHHVQRVAGTIGAVLLSFLMALAAYAVFLRVTQYGLTVERLYSVSAVVVMGFLAAGYTVAALLPGRWLKLIEKINLYTTFLALMVIFANFTPLADPMRLSVTNQTFRLDHGTVAPKSFDFFYLKNDGGRFGQAALEKYAKSANPEIAAAAKRSLAPPRDFFAKPATPKDIRAQIAVHPARRNLPDSFLRMDFDKAGIDYWLKDCFQTPLAEGMQCDAIIRDFDGDGSEDILLVQKQMSGNNKPLWKSQLFALRGGAWHVIARTQVSDCVREHEALLTGRYELVPPDPAMPDLKLPGGRIAMFREDALTSCK
jgi:hypothetical protein